MKFKHSALAVVAGALASLLMPPVPMPPAAWAAAGNLMVPDGPRAGEPWSLDLTPYVREPLDFMAPDSGVNEIAVMKGVQTGFSTAIIAAIGHSIDRDPCNIMLLQPTSEALADFNRMKLQPAIDTSPILKRKVAAQTSRAGNGSTTGVKRFPGGFLALAIASSASDLRSKTIKKLFRDEIDEYPDDLDGQGSPLKLSDGRLTSFLKSGDWKKFDVSTPTIKGTSKIEARYEAGDKRRWHVTCPHCRGADGAPSEFVFEWGAQFQFKREAPHEAHYVAPCCGSIIDEVQRTGMVQGGRWVATDPRPGAFPSYHFDTLSSPFVPWDHIAKLSIEAETGSTAMKSFVNLWLGLPYQDKGDAPDFERLMERREDALVQGQVPARGLMLLAAADVQARGIWCEIIALAPNRETWTVDRFYCEGGTEDPAAGAYIELKRKTLERGFLDTLGNERTIDALAIDSGYNSHAVYAFVRNNQRLHPETGNDLILATKGLEGWGRPAIGTPGLVDINLAGRRVKQGCKVWPVGTWSLKASFYTDLRKAGMRAGAEVDPPGYCHFGVWLDEGYFRQLTAEYLAEEVNKKTGIIERRWKQSERDNHFLDCRIYNLALAEYLGLSRTTPEEWAALARRRGLPADLSGPALFRPVTIAQTDLPPPTAATSPAAAPAPQPAEPPVRPAYLPPRSRGWLSRR